MKTARFFFFMMIAAVLLQDRSFARQSDSASQPTPSQSRKTNDSSESKQDSQVRGEGIQTGVEGSNGEHKSLDGGTRNVRQRHPSRGRVKPGPGHQVRSGKTAAASGVRPETPGNGMGFHLTGSATSSRVANKTVSHRSVSAPSPAVSVNGQQFKGARDPGARLASSGGPPTAARGTAVINGTNMKRKP